MPKKRFSAEQIVTLLRQIEVVMGQVSRPRLRAGMQGSRNRVFIAGEKSTEDFRLNKPGD